MRETEKNRKHKEKERETLCVGGKRGAETMHMRYGNDFILWV